MPIVERIACEKCHSILGKACEGRLRFAYLLCGWVGPLRDTRGGEDGGDSFFGGLSAIDGGSRC